MNQGIPATHVSLSIGNWLTIGGIIVSQAVVLIAFGTNLQSRLAVLEVQTTTAVQTGIRTEELVGKRLDRLDDRVREIERVKP